MIRLPPKPWLAMLIYYGSQGKQIDLAQVGIGRSAYQRYLAFLQLDAATRSSNQQTIRSRLIREFGSSYFFYFKFGRVGVV